MPLPAKSVTDFLPVNECGADFSTAKGPEKSTVPKNVAIRAHRRGLILQCGGVRTENKIKDLSTSRSPVMFVQLAREDKANCQRSIGDGVSMWRRAVPIYGTGRVHVPRHSLHARPMYSLDRNIRF